MTSAWSDWGKLRKTSVKILGVPVETDTRTSWLRVQSHDATPTRLVTPYSPLDVYRRFRDMYCFGVE
jgi:hypothetical protein